MFNHFEILLIVKVVVDVFDCQCSLGTYFECQSQGAFGSVQFKNHSTMARFMLVPVQKIGQLRTVRTGSGSCQFHGSVRSVSFRFVPEKTFARSYGPYGP